MIAQRVPGRVELEEWNRELTGAREEKAELVDGGVVLAHHYVDSGEVLHPIDESKLAPLDGIEHLTFLAAWS